MISERTRLIVCSQQNIASRNMHALLCNEFGFTPTSDTYDKKPVHVNGKYTLVFMQTQILDVEHLTATFSPEVYIVASTHKSALQEKSLTTHATGNWGTAELGGKPHELCTAAPSFMLGAFQTLKQRAQGYTASYEATHHGPSNMNAPVLYVEVGSTPTEWNDLEACRAACAAILAEPIIKPVALCIGGTHYAPGFCKEYILEKYAPGHICPKWGIDLLDESMLMQAIERSSPKAVIALLDWDGIKGAQRNRVTGMLDNIGFPWEKASALKNTHKTQQNL